MHGSLGRLHLEFYLVISLLEFAQVFSSKPESNHCIQIEASESQRGSGYEPVVH